MRAFAVTVGFILILLGILESFPQKFSSFPLLNTLKTNWAGNTLYLFTGIIGVIVGVLSQAWSRFYFGVLGIVYSIWGILGFVYGNEPIFGFIENNIGITWVNIVIAVIALVLGFGSTKKNGGRKEI